MISKNRWAQTVRGMERRANGSNGGMRVQVTILPVWRELHRLAASAERDCFLNNNAKHSLVARLVPCSKP